MRVGTWPGPSKLVLSAAVMFSATMVVALAAPRVPAIQDRPAGGIDGKTIFRFDTFGDEQLWTDTLGMNAVIQSSVSPVTALGVGLKVDASAVPQGFLASHDLNDPATTVQLIGLNAVVGVVGQVSGGQLQSVGITCALCHSTVDDSVAPGIGARLDGWPNRDLNPGAIIALSPAVPAEQKAVYNAWGPGRYDPRFNIDHINGPVPIPPAYGLQKVVFETATGDGPIAYWNNYVAVTQMGGHGGFSDPRIGISITQTPDLVTPVLPALVQYELTLTAPPPPAGSFDQQAARRGKAVFMGQAGCVSCHQPPAFTDVLRGPRADRPRLHDPEEVGQDPTYANRSATKQYRTTPLRALWQHAPYFHDGSAATLQAVVDHYDQLFGLGLTDAQRADLIEYLKSL